MNFVDAAFQSQNTQRREQPVHGISIAIVTGRMGDGTYELRYLSMGANAPSAPARMMMPSAGSKRGVYWMPEVGDEVVVAFEGSDSNSPIILGALYNSNSAPPDQAKPSNDNNVRTIVSRSGHEITLDDSPSNTGTLTLKAPLGIVLETAQLSLNVGGMAAAPGATPGTGIMNLTLPAALMVQSAAITMNATAIALTTTGSKLTSTIVLDGTPLQAL
jgi:phage baseplate assembly protein V